MIQRLPELSTLTDDSERRPAAGTGVILAMGAGGLFWGVVIRFGVWVVWG